MVTLPARSQLLATVRSADAVTVLADGRLAPLANDKEDAMTRKVSLWIVIALVVALAATTAAVIVLATHDERGDRTAAVVSPQEGWSHGWSDAQGQQPPPMMGDLRGDWDGGRDAPWLPWMLFAISTGTAVGLLIAWSPWRTAPAGGTAGPPGENMGSTPVMPMAASESSAVKSEAADEVGDARSAARPASAETTDEVTQAQTTQEDGEATTEA